MPVILAVLGFLGAAGFWWYRAKYFGQAASEVADVAGRAVGAYKRRQFRKKADASTIDSIQDPGIAATVLLVAMATSSGPISQAAEAGIVGAMRDVMQVANPEEELIFAKWATADVADLNSLVTRLSRVWVARLDMSERRQFYDLARKIASVDGEPDGILLSALQRLKDRLGLQTHA